jgi:hypothetical protein
LFKVADKGASALAPHVRRMLNINLTVGETVKKAMARNGFDEGEFLVLMQKPCKALTSEEAATLEKIRNSVPMPDAETPLQKIINPKYADSYLDGSFINYKNGAIEGCVTTVESSAPLKTPKDLYEGLRLDFSGTPFGIADDSMIAIRFTSKDAASLKIPYGEGMPHPADIPKMEYPFTGNGFTASTNGRIVPEFYSEGVLPKSARLIEIRSDGTEILRAEYTFFDDKLIQIYP